MSIQMLNSRDAIPYLFDRIAEPLFYRDNVFFDWPDELLTEPQREIKKNIKKKYENLIKKKVQVKPVARDDLPDLSKIEKLKRYDRFSTFNRTHLIYANQLIEILMNLPDVDKFLSVCFYARDRVNINLFVYAVSIAILHRADTKGVKILSNVQVFPHLYINSTVFPLLLEQLHIQKYSERTQKILRESDIVSNGPTASDLDIEHRLAYWREDVGLNLHHWHWHLVHPNFGDPSIVKKDRRGELFYYMHQQMIARYNFERFSVKLNRVRRFNDFKEPIVEGYFPRIHNSLYNIDYASRQAFSVWRDLRRETAEDPLIMDVNQMHRWRDVILNAIHAKQVIKADGTPESLDDDKGIDILGNIVEASDVLSVNYALYGNLHNMGHNMMAFLQDPDNRYLEQPGVMGDNATAARDPAFYLWHAYVDDIFQTHKELLDPYTEEKLKFPGVTVDGLTVKDEDGKINEFSTYFKDRNIDVNKGLNFSPVGNSFITITHLDHKQFWYNIQVSNNTGIEQTGTFRIFLAPRDDERNEKFVFSIQRRFFIELDRFIEKLAPGQNLIERHSKDSSVTIPYDQLFSEDPITETDSFCKCGWPDYLLIPKGNAEGLAADLFVMISDAKNDTVPGNEQLFTNKGTSCKPAPEYCGLRDQLYPDKQPMGYPFDRRPRENQQKVPFTLDEFKTHNMFVQEVTIKFQPETSKQ